MLRLNIPLARESPPPRDCRIRSHKLRESMRLHHLGIVASSVRYDTSVKPKTQTPFERFTQAMDGLMAVPHSELKKALDREKRDKQRKKRARTSPASVRASSNQKD